MSTATPKQSRASGAAWLLLSLLAARADAQPAGESAARLPSVVVTAARAPQTLDELTADVTIIEAAEIERSGAQTLADLLQRQPGVEITRNGSPASTTGVFLRGANRGHTLVLVDGLRVGSSTVGAASLEAIPLEAIERIEVLRGPASSLYGADAIGGVIQIFTRAPGGGLGASAQAGYGRYDTRVASGALDAALGSLRIAFQAGGRRSDGFNATTDPQSFVFNEDRDGYRSDDVSLNAALALAPGHEATVRVLRNRLDAQFDGGPGFDDRTTTTLTTWQIASRNALASIWTSRLWAGEADDDSTSVTAFGESPFATRQLQYGWQNDVALPSGQLSLALERRDERIAEQAGFAVTRRTTNAAVAILRLRHDAHAIQASLRHDRSSQYGNETTGAIAWGWQIAPAWRITAGYATAFKPPSFNDLYFPGFSNPDLEPERSRSFEAGVQWSARMRDWSLDARATGWRNAVERLIVFGCDADFNCIPRNVDDATLTGVTLVAGASSADTTIRLSLDLQDPKDDATGALLPRRAKQHGTITLLQALGPVKLGAEIVASSHRFDDAANTIRLAGYAIVNLTAEWWLGRGVTLFARGDNVTNRDYVLAHGYATGGAQGFVGVRWQL
jgi:vitamin B12 transporter